MCVHFLSHVSWRSFHVVTCITKSFQFIEYFVCVRCCSDNITCTALFNSHSEMGAVVKSHLQMKTLGRGEVQSSLFL